MHCIATKHITLNHMTLHYFTLHYFTLHYITLHYTTSYYITLHYSCTLERGVTSYALTNGTIGTLHRDHVTYIKRGEQISSISYQ
jgi:hypothetical protein